jgi:hypothetical protein
MKRLPRRVLPVIVVAIVAGMLAGCAQTQVDDAGRALSGWISEAAKTVKVTAAAAAAPAGPPAGGSPVGGLVTPSAANPVPAAAVSPRATAPTAQLLQLPTGGIVASAFGVAGDGAGNTIVVGYAIGVVPPKKRQRDGGFVAKYRPSGELAWITLPPIRQPDRMDGSDLPTAGVEALAVATDASGGIYVGGRMRQGTSGADAQFTAFVARRR